MYRLNRWLALIGLRLAWLGGSALLVIGLLGLPLPAAAAPAQTPTQAPEVFRVPAGSGKVALTFDAGEWPGRVQTILDTLARHHAKATFFLCGIYIDSFPSRAKAIAAAGHELASHSYHNVDHRKLTNQQIRDEIRLQEAALLRVTGQHNVPYWRAPYGYRNDRVLDQVNKLGYRSIMWSLDSLDTFGQPKSANFIYNRLTNRPRSQLDGGILLLHVNPNGTVDSLNRVLNYLDAVGLRQVTVSELLDE
jgi:peptidoglycan/xylan/chitin deacetylase (PgdA/CDA1 family)